MLVEHTLWWGHGAWPTPRSAAATAVAGLYISGRLCAGAYAAPGMCLLSGVCGWLSLSGMLLCWTLDGERQSCGELNFGGASRALRDPYVYTGKRVVAGARSPRSAGEALPRIIYIIIIERLRAVWTRGAAWPDRPRARRPRAVRPEPRGRRRVHETRGPVARGPWRRHAWSTGPATVRARNPGASRRSNDITSGSRTVPPPARSTGTPRLTRPGRMGHGAGLVVAQDSSFTGMYFLLSADYFCGRTGSPGSRHGASSGFSRCRRDLSHHCARSPGAAGSF